MNKWNLGGESGIDWGVGANAAYLFSDVVSRKVTPFEELQSLIDRKINHAEHFADKIIATDLLDVYERHAANDINKTFMGQRGTPQWDTSIALFDRMADLINQRYKNTVAHETVGFGFPEFIYLMGHQLIDPSEVERSLAYVEVANKLGIPEVKEMQKSLQNGLDLQEVMKGYGLDTPKLPEVVTEDIRPAFAQQEKVFAQPGLKKQAPEGGFTSLASREEARRANSAPMEGLAV